jgi:hypothetical protein
VARGRAHRPLWVTNAKSLQAAQCREGWRFKDEPIRQPAPPDDWQTWLLESAPTSGSPATAEADGCDSSEPGGLLAELTTSSPSQ